MTDRRTFIRFMAQVTPSSAERLLAIIDSKLRDGADNFHLLINSPGGSVEHGMAIYNFLKGLVGVDVTTYNFGTVDSIGVIIFCAGKERVCVPHARFLLHPVKSTFHGNPTLDEHGVKEVQDSLKIDQSNIAKVITHTCGTYSKEDVLTKIHERTTLDPETAKEFGLVTKIDSALIPTGQIYDVIKESESAYQHTIPTDYMKAKRESYIKRGSTYVKRGSTYHKSNFTKLW
ncbi:MAG: ATP-dependent Clp protease proteolytic subunit [Alphaproteobacteria bacterium GM202ARS2]|nr:ATP-dependent Clp protease proteolytic subunit [Alphaproteobacteria bacterium GM202ARS2]